MPAPRLVTCFVLLAASTATSCLIATNQKSTIHGKYVSSETLSRVEPGADEAFVIAALGEPSSRSAVDDKGRVLWRWSYSRKEVKESAVLLVLASKRENETKGTVFVEFVDGRVVRTWEELSQVGEEK